MSPSFLVLANLPTRPPLRFLPVAGLALSLALACSGEKREVAAPAAATSSLVTPAAALTQPATSLSSSAVAAEQWAEDAVWSSASPMPWSQYCGEVWPPKPEDPCIKEVVKNSGARPEALRFYEQHGYLLYGVKELGAVDFGWGGAPYMARPSHLLFLNGRPASIDVTGIILEQFKAVERDVRLGRESAASYSHLFEADLGPYAFPEYTEVTSGSATSRPGRLTIVLLVPLQTCRVCGPPLGSMPVEFTFAADGSLIESRYLGLLIP